MDLQGATQLVEVDPPVEAEPSLQLVKRIIASPHFQKSSRLAEFLLYVTKCEIEDRQDKISEQQIGVHVFGRSATYNPGNDSVVRTYARNLRSRLDDYFNGSGKHETLRVKIPKGAYRPVFYHFDINETFRSFDESFSPFADRSFSSFDRQSVSASYVGLERPLASPAQSVEPAIWNKSPYRYFLIAAACLLCFLCFRAGQIDWTRVVHLHRHPLWDVMFNKDQQTLVVPADSSLVLLEEVTHQAVTPDQYERRTYDTEILERFGDKASLISNLAQRQYTSVVDLQASNRFAALPEVVPDRFQVRFARDLHVDDLKTANVILFGSSNSNPWVQLFDSKRTFHLQYLQQSGGYRVWNSEPKHGEPVEYPYDMDDPSRRAYGLIAFLPNLSGTGHVLLVEGTAMAGTQAALDFLFDDRLMKPLIDQSKDHDGSLMPFEVLLETSNIGSKATGLKLLAERTRLTWPSTHLQN